MLRLTTCLTLVLVCVVCGTVQADDVVEWESKKGHKTQATFERLEVVITTKDGRKIRVPFNALSVASQQQALRLMREAEVPEVKPIPKVEKLPDVLPLDILQNLVIEIDQIELAAKLEESTAKKELFMKEEMDKLEKKHGKFKVRFAFPVGDVVQRDGLYKLTLERVKCPFHSSLYVGLYRNRGMYISESSSTAMHPDVTKKEMMEIGKGTHEYEVICEMTTSNLSSIVDGRSSPPINLADCKLVKIRRR